MYIIDGNKIKEEKTIEISKKVASINDKLKLVVIQVGNDPASSVYVKNKRIFCERVGILFEHVKYDSINQNDLISKIKDLNNDNSVTGILVQLPLPENIDKNEIVSAIDPLKDVDGLTPTNIGNLFLGRTSLIPCTAIGVLELLNSINANIEGSNIVIVGDSILVGLPLLALLIQKGATVTICNENTKDLKNKTKEADILIVAIGAKEFIKEDYIKEGSIVIDVGINREFNKLYGDCDFENMKEKCKAITPVPGGVGPLTVTMLINNVTQAYYMQKKD